MKNYQSQLTKVKQAINNYNMLAPGDHLAVALSGGKDSLALLYLMHQLQQYSHLTFTLSAIHIDYGWNTADELSALQNYCTSLNIPFYINTIDYQNAPATFNCSICARLRRGALLATAREISAPKTALGHHLDDVSATVLLNLTQGGRFRSFSPTIHYAEQNITVIRPLIYLPEQTLARIAHEQNLPVIASHCPLGSCSKRSDASLILEQLSAIDPKIKQKIIHALEHLTPEDQWLKLSH